MQELHARLGADYSFESFLKDIQQWMMAYDRNASVSADVGSQNARADERPGDRSPGAVGEKYAKRITVITARELPIAQKGAYVLLNPDINRLIGKMSQLSRTEFFWCHIHGLMNLSQDPKEHYSDTNLTWRMMLLLYA